MTTLDEQCILGIEAAGSAVSVGLSKASKQLGQIWLDLDQPGGEVLLHCIDKIFTLCNLSKTDLQGICVCQGPGSFTGMRIALSTAGSIAFALQLPIYTADRLILAAATLPRYASLVHVIQNAYKGELYHGLFDCSGAKPKPLNPIGLCTPTQLMEQLKPQDTLLGEGNEVLDKLKLSPEKLGVYVDRSIHRIPNALGLIEYLSDHPAGSFSNVPIEPIYLRASTAEIDYKERFGKTD